MGGSGVGAGVTEIETFGFLTRRRSVSDQSRQSAALLRWRAGGRAGFFTIPLHNTAQPTGSVLVGPRERATQRLALLDS
eukprot:COSAG04_NODE_1035_length_8610_cov_7.441194_2_plen_79_part_00